ncbi:MAG: hypothetical protein K0B81_02495 [Candidatus Cloacimonetes bacterium]|nr:hypothetical protein [Candidatus Cloacimonadota bacterium]
MNSEILFYTLVILFILLNFFDGHSTYKVVMKTSIRNERNPIARFIFKIFGPALGIIVLKLILIPLVFLMFYYFRFRNTDMNIILILANFFYLSVVIHNYNVVKKINYYAQLSDNDDEEEEYLT